MKVLGIIPARYASSRFPGKPLTDIHGKTMIQRVYEQAKKANSLHEVIVATDDERIKNAVEGFQGHVMLTSENHNSGTDRCMEVVDRLALENRAFDIVVNIQGDEPYINPSQINQVVSCFSDPDVKIATLAKRINSSEELFSAHINKVIFDKSNNAIYFSRFAIPFQQNIPRENWLNNLDYFKHIGIYAYRSDTLKEITRLERSLFEIAESLEQLRWIENGIKIRVLITEFESNAVDTPEDLSKFLNIS
jgi:3-deoxy-manno-octulosonate cytidylyltransferase (CMP-KDO synthetase)